MKTDIQYELLRDYEDFDGKIPKGTRMTEAEWKVRCRLHELVGCSWLSLWFKPVPVPIYTEDDIIEFANYIIKRDFPKEDTSYELYHKWLLLIN